MKKILANGITIVCKNACVFKEVSLTFKSGHVNEPKVGVAGVYEKLVTSNSPGIGSLFGGSMTSFIVCKMDGVSTLNKAISKLYAASIGVSVTSKALTSVVEDIIKHTDDMKNIPERQVKLAYKHTAFGDSTLWSADEYINKLAALTTNDVKNYMADNLVGKNIVIGYCGPIDVKDPEKDINEIAEVVEKYFGKLPAGIKKADCSLEYTGGFQFIQSESFKHIARFGWYLPKEYNTADTNILMSMLAGRLERSIAEARIDADTNVKVAGYFGLRTLCITLKCSGKRHFDAAVKIILANIKRLQDSEATDRRMETTRSRAANERLVISNEVLPGSVDAAWSLLGRNIDYDADGIISNLYDVTARDVKDVACEIFSKEPTVVLYTRKPYPSFDKIKKALTPGAANKASKTKPQIELSASERAAIDAIDASNPA